MLKLLHICLKDDKSIINILKDRKGSGALQSQRPDDETIIHCLINKILKNIGCQDKKQR
jgi:hypothetical protein